MSEYPKSERQVRKELLEIEEFCDKLNKALPWLALFIFAVGFAAGAFIYAAVMEKP